MRLVKFRVTNYRSVTDSGWIETERVTALIGINESGKTNLLLPLWKLNPAREGEIKPTSDYPKGNYAAVRASPGSFVFITAQFDISEFAAELASMTGLQPEILNLVDVARTFDQNYAISFPNYKPAQTADAQVVSKLIEDAAKEIESITIVEGEEAVKAEFAAALSSANDSIKTGGPLTPARIAKLISGLKDALPRRPAANSSIVPRFDKLLDSSESLQTQLNILEPEKAAGVKDYIIGRLPKFVYYSNYGNLDSEIYLPHVVENLERENIGAREAAKARTLRVLFRFVRLRPEEILELGREFRAPQGQAPTESQIAEVTTKKRERTILLNSAGTDLTRRFRDWWKQGDYTFEFQVDGDHFRIWVSDRQRPEKVELEDRSSGLQWFLSFYLIFLIESIGEHRDAILLLDEPGLSLHPLAQRDLSAFFGNLATTNQLIYTTHSPFLVDADLLDRVRKVFVAPDGSTKASADLRRGSDNPRKSGATYAIYSALNMNVAESILYGCQPVIVEGPSDQHYLSMIKALLIGGQMISPKRELVFPPSHGAKNAKVVASILTGLDEALPIMLLDGDEAGRKMAADLRIGLYQSAKDRILCTDAYADLRNSEVEDLLPPQFLADVVDRWERRSDTPFNDVMQISKPIVPQIEAWAASQNITLEDGWKVDLAREAKKRALKLGIEKFDRKLVEIWTRLFTHFFA